MMLYPLAVTAHVVVAVLAIGLVGAVPLTARLAARSAEPFAAARRLLGALLRSIQVGFSLMVLTGVLLDVSVAGAFHRTGWFKASMAALVLAGFTHARARAALRRGNGLAGVERWGWIMCASVALITILMQMKPLP
jgi:hypothetical protein